MMASLIGNIFRVTGYLCGESTGHRWSTRTKASDAELVFFDLCLNETWNKQSWGWWFETPFRPLWRHRNDWQPLWILIILYHSVIECAMVLDDKGYTGCILITCQYFCANYKPFWIMSGQWTCISQNYKDKHIKLVNNLMAKNWSLFKHMMTKLGVCICI